MADEQQWQAERERLLAEQSALHKDWNRIPRLFWGVVLAVPVGLAFGIGPGMLVVLAVLALVATTAYLVGVRIKVNRSELDDADSELAGMARDRAARAATRLP